MKLTRITGLALVVALALTVAACGGTDTISKDDVAKKVQPEFDKLAQDAGQEKFPEITCEDDLKAEEGSSTRCSATGPDGTLGITVTVSSVEDGNAKLSFKADEQVTE
jgi:hypothetical protein